MIIFKNKLSWSTCFRQRQTVQKIGGLLLTIIPSLSQSVNKLSSIYLILAANCINGSGFSRVFGNKTAPKYEEVLTSPTTTNVNKTTKTRFRNESHKPVAPANFRFIYPEFLPDPKMQWRNHVREKLERLDMIDRRTQVDIPEFYVGCIMAVTSSDPHAAGKVSRFVGQ